ncbi:N-acetylglucosamine-1-phosphotransferase subunits alpha/beta [Macrosteles quadrilineatus]|uniref:N-acetylglucosamine-1-phosphotransferase subunits alpha/beta n=1 Tax=Macrosteles quadrilineatus TaxID=74068 RepID=UPI0023E29E64|nr:N-acetylglucosamine-1-phosphotransferase subunits alpha/beta [Macrosteles quadrilineatus]
MSIWKILQKQLYDILSNKCYLLLFLLLSYTSLITFLHFCEVWLNGSWLTRAKPHSNRFGDNIVQMTLEDRLCQHFPIDVVYTWVNGSDSAFKNQLKSAEKRLRKELSRDCKLQDCLPSHFTAFRLNASDLDQVLNQLSYVSIKSVKLLDTDWTVLRWDSIQTADDQSDKIFKINEKYLSPHHVHWTTEEEATSLFTPSNTIAIRGVNKSVEVLSKQTLEQTFGEAIASIWRFPKIIFAEFNSQISVRKILKGKKWNIVFIKHVMKLNVTRASLVLELPTHLKPDDYSPSRYEDKEELRYSLRSLEKFAPWVRKVFIVTNGQLPYWLDLSNPRVQIVPHESIFTNSSHLPTFSSPAIETHLHRIPGLSEKFLYFNDDILLGEEVLPEDFISPRGGQKVYLSWPVPDCSSVCPWTWVGDGTCDVPCNTTSCDHDGGDCLSRQSLHDSVHFHDSDPDYADYIEDVAERTNRKPNRSLHFTDDYEDNLAGIVNVNSVNENASYAIKNDDDLNSLLDFLKDNGTSFTSDVIKDLFSLLKTVHVNDAPVKPLGKSEKLIFGKRGINSTLLDSILIRKLGKSYVNMMENFFKDGDLSKDTRRPDSGVKIGSRKQTGIRKILSFKVLKSNINSSRPLAPMNLSRTQVGVPPIGVAERFYAFQPEINSLKRKLDTFAESLLHVNSLLNKRYGYKARKVPSHMPHLIDKHIMSDLQTVFQAEYDKTSSHYFRHPQDMQFSFGYFYYLINEEREVSVSEIFDTFDTDSSGTWSDREIRTVLTRLYDLPLQRSSVLNFETSLLYCAKDYPPDPQLSIPPFERYIDSKLPTVTKQLVESCSLVSDLLRRKMGRKKRFLYTLVKPPVREATVGFHMVTSNLSHLLTTLDTVRRKPKKFICLNDNMDATKEDDNQVIRAVLIDFFHSLFPKPSQFELPADYRNRHLYYHEFVVWQNKKRKLSFITYGTLCIAVVVIFWFLFQSECRRIQYKAKKRLYCLFPRLKPARRKLPAKL